MPAQGNFNPVTNFQAYQEMMGGEGQSIAIASAVATQLPSVNDRQTVNRYILDMRSTAFIGTITVKSRRRNSGNPFVALPYTARFLNGAAGTDAKVTTGITTDSIIDIDATDLDIVLDTTAAYTSGTMTVLPQAMQG